MNKTTYRIMGIIVTFALILGGFTKVQAAPGHSTAIAVGAGTYDDSNTSAWIYSGTWQTFNGSGPYNKTLHQSNAAGSYAEVKFNGTRFTLTYLQAPGRGSIDVYIDGAKVHTIAANNSTIVWQATWTSASLSAGTHTVRFVNTGTGWIDLDAIQIGAAATEIVGAGTYDDSNTSAWAYSGTWQTFNGSGPYNKTLHQNNAAGSYAEVKFNGTRFTLTYLKAPGRGSIDVYIDGAKVNTISTNNSTIVWQATWTSASLSAGTHTVRFVNTGTGWIDLDAIQIGAVATEVVRAGTYDDSNTSAWTYSGTWQTFNGSGPYNKTLYQNNTRGNYAEVKFNGVKFALRYLQAPGRGSIDVYIDGAKVHTIAANNSTIIWQDVWVSEKLTAGTHTVRFVNTGTGWIDLDAIHIYDTASISGQPVYAYYYLWWSTRHWQDKLGSNYPYSASPLPLPAKTDADGCNPVSNYAGNQLLDIPTRLVSQDEPGAIEEDIRLAKNAGLTGFWLNWGGDGTTSQTRTSVSYTRRLAEAFAASKRVGGFKNWVSYKAAAREPANYIINDLNFLYQEFKGETAWEKIDGKPVVTFTGSRAYSDADVQKISNAVRDRIYLVGDESRKTLTPARLAMFDAITYYWSTQDPYGNPQSFDQIKEMGDKVHAVGKRWYAPLNPGYNSVLLKTGSCIPRKNGETLRTVWNGNLASNPDGWGLISWNEIAENSHVKPMQKWGSRYLDVLSSLIQ